MSDLKGSATSENILMGIISNNGAMVGNLGTVFSKGGDISAYIVDVKKHPLAYEGSGKYYIASALQDCLNNSKSNNIYLADGKYYLEHPVEIPAYKSLYLDNCTIYTPKYQIVNANNYEYCGFKLNAYSKISGGCVFNTSSPSAKPILFVKGKSGDKEAPFGVCIEDIYIYNGGEGIGIQIDGDEKAAGFCTVRNATVKGGKLGLFINNGRVGGEDENSGNKWSNGHNISANFSDQTLNAVRLKGDGCYLNIGGQAKEFQTIAVSSADYPFDATKHFKKNGSAFVALTAEPTDWAKNWQNYYELNSYGKYVLLLDVASNSEALSHESLANVSEPLVLVEGSHNVIHSSIFDVGREPIAIVYKDASGVKTTEANAAYSEVYKRYTKKVVCKTASGLHNFCFDYHGNTVTQADRVQGNIVNMTADYLHRSGERSKYRGNNILAYAIEKEKYKGETEPKIEIESKNFYLFYQENGAEVTSLVNGALDNDKFKEMIAMLMHRPSSQILLYGKPIGTITDTNIPSLTITIPVNEKVNGFGFSFDDPQFAFTETKVTCNFEGLESSNKKEWIIGAVGDYTKKFDFELSGMILKTIKFEFEGLSESGTVRPINIYAWNEHSNNMLIDMAGGSMYGDLVFEPETLKVKNEYGTEANIEALLNTCKTSTTGNPAILTNISSVSPYIVCKASLSGGDISKNKLPSDITDFSKWKPVGTRAYGYPIDELLEVGKTYCFSAEFKNWTSGIPVGYLYIQEGADAEFATKTNLQMFQNVTKKTPPTFTVKEGYYYRVYYYYDTGKEVFSSYENFMIEEGTTKTEFEGYYSPPPKNITDLNVTITDGSNTTVVNPDENGIIIYPHNNASTLTISASNAELECEYSKDIGKELSDITEALKLIPIGASVSGEEVSY